MLVVTVPRCGEPLIGGVNRGTPEMYDQSLLLQTLSRFAGILPARYDLQEALSELTESVTAVLGLCGSWVTMADDGRLRFVTAVSQASAELERDHAQLHPFPCPCRDAHSTGEVVRVTDVRQESARWPEFSASATRLSIAGVAAIPMRLADQIIGALNLYSPEPREWSDEDIAVAIVLADVATSYVVNASKLRQQEQLSEQLQEALESRVVIEQAKGMTSQQNSVTIDQAYQLMRSHARKNNASLRAVAEAIVAVGLRVGARRP
jgi:GAF domain-containing protein